MHRDLVVIGASAGGVEALRTLVADLFARLEACGQLMRLDPSVDPTMYRCASLSQSGERRPGS